MQESAQGQLMLSIQLMPGRLARWVANSGNFIVRRLPLVVCGLLVFPMFLFVQAQETVDPTAKPNLIAEVIATDDQLNTRTKYVFMRAFSDGTVEYHDPWHFDLFEPALIRKKMLAEQLSRLKKMLSEPEVSKLSGEYHGGQGVDTSLLWEVTVATPSGARMFALHNFTYGFDHGLLPGRPITEPARRIGCALEEVSNQMKGWTRHFPQCDRQNDHKK
jgi:hypothetical protein